MWLFYYNCAGLHRGFAQLFGKKPENPRRTGPGLVSFPREACGRNRLREIPQFHWAVICLFSSSFSPGSIDFLPAVSYNEDRSFQNTLTTERTRLAAWGGAPRMLSQRTSSCLPVPVPPCDFLRRHPWLFGSAPAALSSGKGPFFCAFAAPIPIAAERGNALSSIIDDSVTENTALYVGEVSWDAKREGRTVRVGNNGPVPGVPRQGMGKPGPCGR